MTSARATYIRLHTRRRVARPARSHTAPLICRAVTALAARRSTLHMSCGRVWVPYVSCVATYSAQNTVHVKGVTPLRFFFSWIEPCGPHGPHGCPRAPAISLCETTTPLVRPVCHTFIGHLRGTAAKPRGRLPDRAAARGCRRVVPTLFCRAPYTCVTACAACTRCAQRWHTL